MLVRSVVMLSYTSGAFASGTVLVAETCMKKRLMHNCICHNLSLANDARDTLGNKAKLWPICAPRLIKNS